MEEDDEIPPLAVQLDGINEPKSSELSRKSGNGRTMGEDSVGVTVITGYLGAGKSTVSSFQRFH